MLKKMFPHSEVKLLSQKWITNVAFAKSKRDNEPSDGSEYFQVVMLWASNNKDGCVLLRNRYEGQRS